MLPVTIQHPDGVVYHFYNAKDSCSRKGSRIVFSKIDESKASRFLSLFSFEDLSKIYKLLPKKDLERAFPKKHIIKALTAGTLLAFEECANDDVSETEMTLLRLEIKMTLNQILSVEIAEAADIEKSLENKNAVQKILLYKREYDKGFIDAGIEFLTWIKDIYEVVSPTENLKRAIDAGWETYKADSSEWRQTFADKLKASNYKEVIDALGFDPGKLSTEQIVEIFESAKLIYDDEKTQELILKFIRDYAGAQHSLEWANFIGSAAFDIVLTALLAFATGGVGAVASVGSKAGRLMKPLAKLGEKFSELAKKLSKKFKPKKRKKTKVGGGDKGGKESGSKNKRDKNEELSNSEKQKAIKVTEDADKPLEPVNPNKAQHGHGHAEHGHQTTETQQENRIRTGVKPSGEQGNQTSKASKFSTPEKESEALNKGRNKLEAEVEADSIPTMVNGEPNRHAVTVESGDADGFGERWVRSKNESGQNLKDANDKFIPEKDSVKLGKAKLIYEYVPTKGVWEPVTYFPVE